MSEQPSFPWASQMIEIKARNGQWSVHVYEPLIKHRWQFYAREKAQALQKLQMLPHNTIQAILEHLYANTPVARTNLPAFKTCKVVDSIPFESTYHRDMMQLLDDESSWDFALIPRDSEDRVNVHRFMLYARSGFFRSQFETNSTMLQFRDPNMCKAALEMFAGYIYTGRLDPTDAVALVDLFGAGKNYQLRDPLEIDFLAMNNLQKLLTPQNAAEVKARAEERKLQEVINLVQDYYPC
ncbi:hypothetical protein TVAG_379120 [Trichomonas vaginalis G3]|uniref:BTB domain-containing protein n=1 Tax=Trichomonas vaginalis (strain ATCC PRA-98 / G3) TaxID=412133 RepID=A2DBA3_TRIV3|nr:Potassium Channel Kv1.1, Chain A domain-containing protein [Trichomonas vaginalis G3]EAY22433.1 hypothetical protein TVAG_379120 [Trichomonas vaginalis G3]KAI5517620.1 Potassium Channel Kv1.1, Chain A domain-containing protein [Trichomonas vaginalis G3]|eukprot:XP_001583419.1 hypothetical protein [Trichomonas vaginalis G3]